MQKWQENAGAYMQIQGTRPQTITQSLVDSPSALLAWIVEKFQEWTDPAAKLPEDAVDRDRILTDVSVPVTRSIPTKPLGCRVREGQPVTTSTSPMPRASAGALI